VGSHKEALPLIEQGGIEVLVTDLRLGDGDGVTLIEAARRCDPRTAIIAITAFGSIDEAVRAVRQGAFEFLTKPLEPSTLKLAIERALEAQTLRHEVERLRAALLAQAEPQILIGKSRALADIMALIERVADSDASVLITGPSGSGKELVVRALHRFSRRRDQPLVAVNAAALPEALIESELFGHRKGAFTDARADKPGLFQEAHGGTLFLDEIGDMPLGLQAKLLRVLQDHEVRPVGATRASPVDVRVIAATNCDLKKAMEAKQFRSDLYFRLAVIEISLPALRDRPEDILPLAEHFLQRAIARTGKSIKGFSAMAARRLHSYAWPGNVRELENAVEHAVALSRDEWLSPDDLPAALGETRREDLFSAAAERLLTLEEVERSYVRHVLERFGGNKKRAADVLGINRRTIQRWLGEQQAGNDQPGDEPGDGETAD
jgi:DNA-binding NtrC family response regulator